VREWVRVHREVFMLRDKVLKKRKAPTISDFGLHCRTKMAHTRQSRPDSGLGLQVKFLKML